MSRLKIVAFSVLGVILSLATLEVGAGAALITADLIRGRSLTSSLESRRRELALAWGAATYYGAFDPVVQVRHVPGTFYGERLVVNRHGFIANDNSGLSPANFPEKPGNTYRIILLGGSSVAGSGAGGNTETISAQLEKILNERERDHGHAFEVLNFGGAGGYTGAELIRFLTQVIYIEPDIVINLDGYNDAWNATLEHHRVGLDHPIINWSDFSYQYFEVMNGFRGGVRGQAGYKVMTFSSIVVGRTIKRVWPERRRELYEALPLYRQSERIKRQNPYFENVIYSNLDAFAAYALQNKLRFLAYLQPHAMEGKRLTDRERTKTESFFRGYASVYGEAFRKDNYLKSIIPTFEAYGKVYRQLGDKYGAYQNVRFTDLRELFNGVPGDVYIDVIHYTPYGNQLLAERFYADIKAMLARKS